MEKSDQLEELDAAGQIQLREQFESARTLYRFAVMLDSRTMYLANQVQVNVQEAGHSAYFETTLTDCWAWDSHRQVRTLPKVLVHSFDAVIVEDWGPR